MATMSSNLRRRSSTSVVVRPTRNSNWRDWADLSQSVASQIARHALANDVADYLHFRAACAPWRDNTEDPKQHSVLDQRFHPRRWIMLPKESSVAAADNRSWRRMVNLSHGTKITLDLPHLLGHAVASGSGGSPGGILVLIHEQSLAVRLLNPLTGQRIDLPSVASVLSRRREGPMDKEFSGLCNVTGAGFAGDSTVVLHFGYDNKLVSAKIGGDRWEIVSEGSLLCSAFPFYGKVYFANGDGLMVVDAEAAPPKLVLAAQWPPEKITFVHMADSSGELMVLTNMARFRKGSDDYMVEFEIFRLDADAGVLVPVTDLGERAVFVGDYGGGLVVSAKGIVPNTIYFQHDRYNRFYVRRVSDDQTRLLTEAQKGSFIDSLTSYVAWNGRKSKSQVVPADARSRRAC